MLVTSNHHSMADHSCKAGRAMAAFGSLSSEGAVIQLWCLQHSQLPLVFGFWGLGLCFGLVVYEVTSKERIQYKMTACVKYKSITVLWEPSEKKTQSHWNATPSTVRSAHQQVSKSLWSLLDKSKTTKGTSDFCPWLAGRRQPRKQACPLFPPQAANGPGKKSLRHLAVDADRIFPVSQWSSFLSPLFHMAVLKERGAVLLRSWSPGLARFVTLGWVRRSVRPKFKVKLSRCEGHGNQSKQEVCMDPLRVGDAEFHMVLKKKIIPCLWKKNLSVSWGNLGTFSQHLIH